MATTEQIRCPSCNGAHAKQASNDYACDFCMQPFTVRDAEKEESRLLEQIKSWVQQKVGATAVGGGGVDISTRSFLFQQKVLPELRRDVDRALETLGAFGQFRLVPPPIPVTAERDNPLVQRRPHILTLKDLRARLASEQVGAFATTDVDKAAIQTLDRRLAELVYLSNVAEAASRRTAIGFSTARRNLESLLAEVDQSLALEGTREPGLAAYLAAVKARYSGLVELCRVCEEIADSASVSGATTADHLERVAIALDAVGPAIEASDYSPADTMPMVVGVRQEAAACRTLAKWLRSFDALSAGSRVAFSAFVQEVAGLFDGAPLEATGELLEVATFAVRAARGEVAIGAIVDDGWVGGWAEGARTKKAFGLFGAEERIARTEPFLLPIWAADVSYSAATGAVFKEGVEAKAFAIVDACSPTPERVRLYQDANHPIPLGLAVPRVIRSSAVALPRSTSAAAQTAITSALRARTDVRNPQVRVRGLGFVSAAVVHFDSSKGTRELVAAVGGGVPVDAGARVRLHAMQQLLQRLG